MSSKTKNRRRAINRKHKRVIRFLLEAETLMKSDNPDYISFAKRWKIPPVINHKASIENRYKAAVLIRVAMLADTTIKQIEQESAND